MAKHTPGPWAGGIATIFRVSDPSGKVKRFVMACPRNEEYNEANRQDPLGPKAKRQLHADAALAAAAPDLLRALRAVVRERRRESSAALTEARAAIKQATS